MCRAMPFSARDLKKNTKNIFFDVHTVRLKTKRNLVDRGLYSYRQRVHVVTLFPNNFIAGGQIFKIAASRFVNVSEEEINLMKENAFPRNTKHATKFRMTLFKGKM